MILSFLFPLEISLRLCLAVPALTCGILLIWRVWRFSLEPFLSPDSPRQLPYWVPFLGHAIRFSKNPQDVFSSGQKYFGRVGRPYSLTIAGQTFYVLTDPQDFSNVYRNGSIFTFNFFVEMVYKSFQISEATIQKLRRPPASLDEKSESVSYANKDVLNISHETVVVKMRGKLTSEHSLQAKRQLDRMIDLDSICARFSTERDHSSTVVSAFRLCSIMVIAAGQAAYFGDALSEIDPFLPEAFLDFDKSCWEIFFRPPIFWSKQMTRSKTQLLHAFEAYVKRPLEQRPGMPEFLQIWEMECVEAGLNSSDIATILLIQYFGVNTNTPKACFWLLCHILFRPELVGVIRDETQAAFISDGNFNYDILEKSKQLHAIWLETLRLSASSLSFRYVSRDISINGLRLLKGNQVALNPRPLHIDPEYFGSDPLDFNPQRFLDNTTIRRHPAFRPFGGGEPMCPGRKMAKHTALTFIGVLLHEYDVELVEWPTQKFPRPSHQNHPGVAVMPPEEGSDSFMRLIKRREKKK